MKNPIRPLSRRIRPIAPIKIGWIEIRTFRPDSSSPPEGHMDRPAFISIARVDALTHQPKA
ncbi:MAG: hypothetical protein JJ902_03940 [Roseibium sp.]|nr:hypothetical protein [Roseibium sp.]